MPKSTRVPASVDELLRSMVGYDTVNSSISGLPDAELELSRFLETQAGLIGLETQRLPVSGEGFNLLVSHRVGAESPWLLFESHLDTVSVEGMTVDPFAGLVEGSRLYGRGACDTKGTGAAMLWALKGCVEDGAAACNVAILYTVDEEITKTGVHAFVRDQLPSLGWKPQGVIVGEPTRLRLVVATNGVVRWRIATRGVAAHSSNPSRGLSAISMMVKVIDALESCYIPALAATHPLTGQARCSLNMIRGGEGINIVPEHCEIHIDRRLVPGEEPDQVIPAVQELLDELGRADELLQVTQEPADMLDYPLDPAGGEAFARHVQGILRGFGLPARPEGVGYGTDASTLARAGIPVVVLGPGDISQAHTHDEWIDLDDLHRGVEVYASLMRTAVTQP